MLGMFILAAALTVGSPATSEDVVVLRSGERVGGVVFEEDPVAGVRIRLADGTVRHFTPAQVAHVEWAEPPPPALQTTPPAVLPAVPVPVTAEPPVGPPHPRDPWYLRLTLGIAGAELGMGDGTMSFGPPNANVPIPFAFAVGAGVAVGDRLAVGGEWSLGYSMHSVSDDLPEVYDRSLVLQHLGVVATFYPATQRLEEWPDVPLAPRGPSLRVGVAAAFLDSRPDPSNATSDSRSWHAIGLGVGAGCGWAWRMRKDRTLDLAVDLAWDRFATTTEPTSPDSAFSYQVNLGMTFF
jgi:hypothetical protein